jgi:hypothetical protein
MVKIHVAYTTKINPQGATPVLTSAQVWQGLQRKIRFAQEFVPIIESCDVLEDKDGVVVRDVRFKEGTGPQRQAKEVVRSYWPSWVSLFFFSLSSLKSYSLEVSLLVIGGLANSRVDDRSISNKKTAP